jgi:hypothetical protein
VRGWLVLGLALGVELNFQESKALPSRQVITYTTVGIPVTARGPASSILVSVVDLRESSLPLVLHLAIGRRESNLTRIVHRIFLAKIQD